VVERAYALWVPRKPANCAAEKHHGGGTFLFSGRVGIRSTGLVRGISPRERVTASCIKKGKNWESIDAGGWYRMERTIPREDSETASSKGILRDVEKFCGPSIRADERPSEEPMKVFQTMHTPWAGFG